MQFEQTFRMPVAHGVHRSEGVQPAGKSVAQLRQTDVGRHSPDLRLHTKWAFPITLQWGDCEMTTTSSLPGQQETPGFPANKYFLRVFN